MTPVHLLYRGAASWNGCGGEITNDASRSLSLSLRNSLGSFLLPSPFRLYISHDHDDGGDDREEEKWNHAALAGWLHESGKLRVGRNLNVMQA